MNLQKIFEDESEASELDRGMSMIDEATQRNNIRIIASADGLTSSARAAAMVLSVIDLQATQADVVDAVSSGQFSNKADKIDYAQRKIIRFISQRVRWSEKLKKLYIRSCDGQWSVIDDVNLTKVKLSLVLNQLISAEMFKLGDSVTEKVVDYILDAVSSDESNDRVIQFGDCVLTQSGKLVDFDDDVNATRPAYISLREIMHDVKPVSVVDDLINHISGDDPETKERLLDLCSMVYVIDSSIKSAMAKIVMLYGPTAENGKSTFINLLLSAVGKDVSTTVPLNKFNGFNMSNLPGKLLVVDPDGSGQHIDHETANNLKKIVSVDMVQIDRKHRDSVSCTIKAQLVMASNGLPKSEDKSHGWERRIEWFPVERKLERDDEWFNELRSERAAAYMNKILVERAARIMQTGHIAPQSDRVNALNAEYASTNNNVKRWLSERDINKDIHLHKLDTVRSDYEDWCEENAETPLGRNNFSQALEAMSTLRRRTVALSNKTDDLVELAKLRASGKKTFRLWVDISKM